MTPATLVLRIVLFGSVSFVELAAVTNGQNQAGILQFGSAGGDSAMAVASDGSGGVYVSGYTTGSLAGANAGAEDVWLAHYDRTGSQTWIQQFGTSQSDTAEAAAFDGVGGVYVCGRTNGSLAGPHAGSEDVWLARYDHGGNRVWVQQIGSNSNESAVALAPDGSGGVYISGGTSSSLAGPMAGITDAWFARYDSAGNQTWIRQLGSNRSDGAGALASDGSGGVYVGGSTDGALGGAHVGDSYVWLARYDGAGNQFWIRQFGSYGGDYAFHAAPDGTGGVYVSGRAGGPLGGPSAGDDDVWVARYDGAGNRHWIRQFGSNRFDDSWDCAPDGSGGLYIAGWSHGNLAGPSAGYDDAWLAHFDSTGDRTWTRQFGSPFYDFASAVAADESGGAYVCGWTNGSLGGPNAGHNDAWLARYETLATAHYCSPAMVNSTGQAASLSATGENALQANDLTLVASQLGQNSFGYFLTSRTQGHVNGAGGSQGTFCLGGAIGRFHGPGQIMNSGPLGTLSLAIDLATMPQPLGTVAVQSGETWNFQAWYRDANPGATSNFTNALSVVFQ
jgi:hypothetical protein